MRKGNSVVNKIKQNGVKYTIHTTRCLGRIRRVFQHLIILLFRNWTYHRIIFTCPIGQVGCRFHMPRAIGQPLMSNPALLMTIFKWMTIPICCIIVKVYTRYYSTHSFVVFQVNIIHMYSPTTITIWNWGYGKLMENGG